MNPQPHRVGELRPNQLLHTYGVGAIADLPNLSVIVTGLDDWELAKTTIIPEERLLAAVRAQLGPQVETLRTPPHLAATQDPFAEWTRVGVPVWLFPRWLRCSRLQCNKLAPVESGFFELLSNPYAPDRTRYVDNCHGNGGNRPLALPARFVLACGNGHLDDFPWMYYVHNGVVSSEKDHTLRLYERGTTGEAASLFVECSCELDASGRPRFRRSMAQAFGQHAWRELPACRGRRPHLRDFESCGLKTRTLGLGATNNWFSMRLRAFTLPRAETEVDHQVAEFWELLKALVILDEAAIKAIVPTQTCWPELEPYGLDQVYRAIRRRAAEGKDDEEPDSTDLETPEWEAFTQSQAVELPDFTTRREPPPKECRGWLDEVVLAPRLRQVSALYGFTRIDAPEWDTTETEETRRAPLTREAPTWLPCAELRGEGIFLRFNEKRLADWEQRPEIRQREQLLQRAHEDWRAQRRMEPGHWPGIRYVLLHTFAHVLIREFALESGYSASGIAERIYARSGDRSMAGVLLYTAAPDSEGTLGGLVSLGHRDRLGALIEQALDSARLCSSDPLCADHDPLVHGRLYGAACHACLFSAETSCERGNHYLDRALLVDTVTGLDLGFLAR